METVQQPITEQSRAEALALYAVYVDTITANESRRQQLSIFYLSIISAGVAVLGTANDVNPLLIVAPIFVVSTVWYLSIRYFRVLAQAKFKVIFELEEHFAIKPFRLEYTKYKGTETSSEKTNKKTWLGLTHLDMVVPFLIMVVSSALTVHLVFFKLLPGCFPD